METARKFLIFSCPNLSSRSLPLAHSFATEGVQEGILRQLPHLICREAYACPWCWEEGTVIRL
jgi:hypothetical protein